MRIPIPDDWNGTRWKCVQIEWPDSPLFFALLSGFLTQMTRGRFWDERSGIITNAQAIGWQIHDRNFPFMDCAGNPIEGGDQPGSTGGGIVILEDDMGQVVTEIKIVEGKLRVYYGHCCWDELDISSAIVEQSDELGDDPLNPTGDPDYVYSSCGKAWAIVRAIRAVLEASFGALSLSYPWQYLGYVEDQTGFNLNDKWTTALVIDWFGYGAILNPDQVFSNSDMQKSVSALVNVFADDAIGVPDGETYEAVKSALHTQNLIYDGLVMTAVAALGRNNLDAIAKKAAGDTGQDCGEMADFFSGFGEGFTWSHVLDFRNQTLPAGFVVLTDGEIATIHTPGVGLWSEVSGTGDQTDVRGQIPIAGTPTGAITKVGLVIREVGDEQHFAYTGFLVRLDNPADDLLTVQALVDTCGDNPSTPGTWTIIRTCNGAYAAGAPTLLRVVTSAGHPPETDPPDSPDVSEVIVALALAGTGDDPWPNLP